MNLSKTATCLSLLACLAFVFPSKARGEDQRISFRRGAIRAQVTGTLTGIGQQVCYRANARAGQHMKVEIVGDGPTRGTVQFPSGEGSGMPGGVIFDEDLTETGDFRICVEESQMGNGWNGKFTLKLYIK